MKERIFAVIGKLVLDISHANSKEQVSAALKKAFQKMQTVVPFETTSCDKEATDKSKEGATSAD